MPLCLCCGNWCDDEESVSDDPELVEDLAAAIRRADRGEAEYQLDKLVANSDRLKTAVSQGRFGGRARA